MLFYVFVIGFRSISESNHVVMPQALGLPVEESVKFQIHYIQGLLLPHFWWGAGRRGVRAFFLTFLSCPGLAHPAFPALMPIWWYPPQCATQEMYQLL